MLLAVDFDKALINKEAITVTSVLSFQAAGINGTELNAPQAYRFTGDSNDALSQ